MGRASLIQHWHGERQAEYVSEGRLTGTVRRYGGTDNDAGVGMTLCDLSLLPRTGFKGAGTSEWLHHHAQLPELPNQSVETERGELIMRLGRHEYLVLNGLTEDSDLTACLGRMHRKESPEDTWQLPRQDSHCLFVLSGDHTAELLATLCAIDFNDPVYAAGRVAQTSIARVSGIVCWRRHCSIRSCYILADISLTEYLWGVLMQSGESFNLQPCGLDALPE